MTEVSERYGGVAAALTRRVDGIGAEQWDLPTPCSEWTVRELLAHVVGVHYWVMAKLDGGEPPAPPPDDELVAGWRAATAAVSAALDDPTRASTVVTGMSGEQSFESLVETLLCADTLIHVWDLARATGQDESLEPAAVTRVLAFLTPMDEPMRRPGGFAAKIDPGPGADEQTRLLNFCGRAV